MATTTSIIENDAALQELLDQIDDLPTRPPSLFINVEGGSLNPHKSQPSIISIYLNPLHKTYLIDVWKLGGSAFSVTNQNQTSLKTILESPSIPKVVFDVREGSEGLFSHFEIKLQGIKDLQVMELAARFGPPQDNLSSLIECVERDASLLPEGLQTWRNVESAVAPLQNRDGRWHYYTINIRPIRQPVIEYCVQNVILLPRLLRVYHPKLCVAGNGFWRYMVFSSVQKRLRETQSSSYDPAANDKKYGWAESYVEDVRNDWGRDLNNWTITGESIFDQRFINSLDYY